MLGGRGEQQRPEREPERAAGDMDRHREAAMAAAEPMRERRRRRMKRGGAEAPDDQHRREHRHCRRNTDKAQDRDRHDRPAHHEQSWAPAIRDVAEADLRDRRRHLVQHRQRACGGEREMQFGDEQGEQRSVDVAVAVDHEMRAGHQQHGGMYPSQGRPVLIFGQRTTGEQRVPAADRMSRRCKRKRPPSFDGGPMEDG